jgi:hypothetical protein
MTRARDLASGLAGVRPFATASGTVNVTQSFGPSNGFYYGLATVTFPVGRFSQVPVVTIGSTVGNVLTTGSIGTPPSTTSVTVYAVGSVVSQVSSIQWMAVQMTPTSGAG